jgi:hypothetical protein
VADVIDEDVPELLVALQRDDAAAMRPAVQVEVEVEVEAGSDMHDMHDMDTYGDYHDDYDDLEDEHGEKRRPAIPEYREAEAEEGAAAAAATVYTASNCRLLKAEMDDRLAPFCALQTDDLRRFVVNYLISRKVCRRHCSCAQPTTGAASLTPSLSYPSCVSCLSALSVVLCCAVLVISVVLCCAAGHQGRAAHLWLLRAQEVLRGLG